MISVGRLVRLAPTLLIVLVVAAGCSSSTSSGTGDSNGNTEPAPTPLPPSQTSPRTVETAVTQCGDWYQDVQNLKFDSLNLIEQAEAGELDLADETLIVKFHSAPRLSVSSLRGEPLSPAAVHTLNTLETVSYRTLGQDTVQVTTAKESNPWEVARRLNEDPAVRYVEPNLRLIPLAVDYSNQQWAHTSFGVQQAWDVLATPPGQDVRVAVLDEGFLVTHDDLQANVSSDQWDFADDDGDVTTPANPVAMQHGTHVAGIIGALDNSFGVNGVAPSANLVLAKVFTDAGLSSTANLVAAIEWASGEVVSGSSAPPISEPVDIINISLGVPTATHSSEPAQADLQSVQEALAVARSQGILTFAATGNNEAEFDFTASDGVFPPANGPCAIAVGSVNESRYRSLFSQYSDQAYLVGVVAPGGVSFMGSYVISTIAGEDGGPAYGELAGTSMSAPYVAGTAAMLMSENPSWTDEQVLTELLTNTGWSSEFNAYEYGFGVVCPDKIMGADTVCGQ
jgi:subtilisin family serine protease